jgi:hypothetical protein
MHSPTLINKIVLITSTAILAVLVLIPFHAFITVWLASALGHYTLIRLWKEIILLFGVAVALYLVITDATLRKQLLTRRLVWLVLGYALVTLLWALIAYEHGAITLKAAAYGCLLNLRYLAFFLVVWTLSLRTKRLSAHWQKVVLIPAAAVVLVGLLQAFILPHDILRHFGYGDTTIPAYETINHNAAYLRIQSVTRGANPLGAYLIIPLSVTMIYLTKHRRDPRLWLLFSTALLVLFETFSRSAWLGCVVAAGVIGVVMWARLVSRQWLYVLAGLVLVLGALLAINAHRSTQLENIIFHTQTNSDIKTTSDQGHVSALRDGIHDVVTEPLGRGPGSAGPASVYNGSHPVRIAENYYIQIGQEVGWLGLGLFLAINVGVGYILWLRRSDSLALALFASFIGLIVVNMLSHAWTDDTLAYLWWGLAGMAVATTTVEPKSRVKHK